MFPFNKPTVQPPAAVHPDQIKPAGDGVVDPAAAKVITPNPDGTGTPEAHKDPLDVYAKLWDDPVVDPNAPIADPTHLTIPQEALDKVLPTLDFAKSIPPELQQQFANGEPEAVTKVMNHIGQQSYATAMQHMAAVTDAHLEKRFANLPDTIHKEVRAGMTRDTVNNSENHPLVKAELQRVSAQLAKKYPEASQEWVSKQATDYISNLGNALGAPANNSEAPKLPDTVDFMALASEDD